VLVPGRIQRLREAPGRFGRNISVASRLALVVVLVALVSVVVTSLVGLQRGGDLAEKEIRAQLSAVGVARADQVERYVASLERSVIGQSLTPRPARAIEEFSRVFREIDAEPPSARDQALVETYYRDVVAPELSEARDAPVSASGLVPISNAAITLQARYVVPVPDGELARDPDWRDIHDPLDDALRELALRSGFDDFYLIDPLRYVVLYSTEKDIDFATSLRSGPHSGSQLAALIDELAADPTPGAVAIRDFAPYAPAGGRPSGFVGSPVFLDGELAGFVAGRFGPDEVTAIMTNDQSWGTLGDSGETYVVAADSRMRSDARLFLEDRPAYFEQVETAGTASADEIRSMRLFDTTVLFQEVDYRQVDAVFDGNSGVGEATNYLGQEVLSVGRALDIEGLDWAVFTEEDIAAIRAPITDFTRNLLVAIAVIIVVVTFVAVRWADRLLEPLRVISLRLRTIRDGGEITRRAELPAGSADEFVELSNDIDTMLATLRRRSATSRRRADELRQVLRRLLPASIVERAEAGDRDIVEQVAVATVAVVVIGGLGALVSEGSSERARELLDRFVDEADDLAAERGLDRVQLSGDAYVAACGVSRPHLDHASRAAAFVLDVSEMLRDLDPDGDLYVRAGLDVGPITVGLTGGSRLIHDTWGESVQGATDLARSALRGQILVSDACRSLLPTSHRFESAGRGDASVLVGVGLESEVSS
jgi:class 3 adenylate cyclase